MKITRPTLLVDELKCRNHIEEMRQKAQLSNTIFRPHFKSHQSRAIGNWYRDAGVKKITTSSLAMAAYFARDGWEDITVAFPLNYLEYELINSLAEKIQLNLTVVSLEAIELLAEKLRSPINLFIEIDTGYGRTGIAPSDLSSIDSFINFIENDRNMSFSGFLSHAGHSYKCRSQKEIENVHQTSVQHAFGVAARYRNNFPNLISSVGDTPTCSVVENFSMVDEIRPGNFIFYDVTQTEVGACAIDEVAVAVACPIVAIHPSKNEIVIHGGAVHLSKDSIQTKDGRQIFGRVAILMDESWEVMPESFYVKGVSQEHGLLAVPPESLNQFKIGDVIGILPAHACLTADCMGSFTTLKGEKLDHFKSAR